MAADRNIFLGIRKCQRESCYGSQNSENFVKRCRVTEHPFFGQVRVTTKQILISTTTCRDIRNSSLHSRFARPRLSKHASFQCHSLSELGNRSFLDSLLSFLSETEWCSLWHPEKAKTRTLCQVTSLLEPLKSQILRDTAHFRNLKLRAMVVRE